MRVLISGSHGCMGRALAAALRAAGHAVVAAERERPPLEQARAARPEVFFHLAGLRHADPATLLRVNCAYGVSWLHALDEAGLADTRVFLIGSAAEYGPVRDDELPVAEDHPCRPADAYGCSKYAQTLSGLAAARRGRLVTVLRPFTVLGPGLSGETALGSFVRQLREIRAAGGEGVLEVGRLDTARDYIDVDDLARIALLLLERTDLSGRVINVCSGRATPIRALLDHAIAGLGVRVSLREDPARLRRVDMPRHFGDNRRLRELLGGFEFADPLPAVERMVMERMVETP